MQRTGTRLLAAGMACIGMGLICGPLRAQQSPEVAREQKVSIDAKKTTLLTVVERLMKKAHASYTLDSQLLDAPIGAIHLTDVPFRIALDTALRASGKPATYRLEAGVYMVIAKAVEPEAASGMGAAVNAGEAQGAVAVGAMPENPRVALMVDNADLFDTLKLLFKQAHAQYTLDPSLHNIHITVNLHQPLRAALDSVLRASAKPLTYRMENNVYSIVPKADDPAAPTETPALKP